MDAFVLRYRSQLLAAGFTDRELRRQLETGKLVRVRPGVYLAGAEAEDEAERHRHAIHASLSVLHSGAVASHGSAVVLHGLPTWKVPLRRVQVTRPRAYGGRRERLVHLRVARLDSDEVERVDGVLVTTVARTVIDLARSLTFEAAVAVGDAALAARRTNLDDLTGMLRRSARRPGCSRARRVVAFLDGRAESVGESRSRVAIARAGLPAPVPQHEVFDADGGLIGRVDFWWPERQVVGEFDGEVKYGRALRPGQDPGEVVFQEKLREDRLRAEGIAVVRWIWSELDAFQAKAVRLGRALS